VWSIVKKMVLCAGIVYMLAVDPDDLEKAMADMEKQSAAA